MRRSELVTALVISSIAIVFAIGPRVLWYSIVYRVTPDKVFIFPKPTDCDLDPAPIGKGCHYEKLVTTLPAHDPNYDTVTIVWIKRSD